MQELFSIAEKHCSKEIINSPFLENPRISPRFKRQAPQDSKSNMPKSVYTAAYSFYPVNRAYVPEKTHIFKKTMPFNGPKKSWAPRKVSIFCRTHLETYNRPHLVIW